jgi:hypothetical protein
VGVPTISVKGRERGGCTRNPTKDEERERKREEGFLRNPPTTQKKILWEWYLVISGGRGGRRARATRV